VYLNYARTEDFDTLVKNGVDLKGKVGLARYVVLDAVLECLALTIALGWLHCIALGWLHWVGCIALGWLHWVGCITLWPRYGAIFRGTKAMLAQQYQMIGLLIYSDPADDGYAKGTPYPEVLACSRSTVHHNNHRTIGWQSV
jgi:hypothetical protein